MLFPGDNIPDPMNFPYHGYNWEFPELYIDCVSIFFIANRRENIFVFIFILY